jgi:hypothetical protein
VSGLSREVLLGFAAGAITIVAIAIAVVLLHGTGRSNDGETEPSDQAVELAEAAGDSEPVAEPTTTPIPADSSGELDASPTAINPEATGEVEDPNPVVEMSDEPTAPPTTEPPSEPQIDPLFLIYICNQRNDPAYPAALEQWGYLTHGGKELLCLEYSHGNLEFALHHQGLIDSERDTIFDRYPHEINPRGFIELHDRDPEGWHKVILAHAGLDLRTPSGGFLGDRVTYSGHESLAQAQHKQFEVLTIADLGNLIHEWVRVASGDVPSTNEVFQDPGTLLSEALSGTPETHLSRRIYSSLSSHRQYEIIRVAIEASGTFSIGRSRETLIFGQMERVFDNYRNYRANGTTDLRFDQWLVANADQFLAYFWPNANWEMRTDPPSNDFPPE